MDIKCTICSNIITDVIHFDRQPLLKPDINGLYTCQKCGTRYTETYKLKPAEELWRTNLIKEAETLLHSENPSLSQISIVRLYAKLGLTRN